jgi:hypothetical protein
MASNAARGARYKGKTKKFLEAQGYAVAHLEMVHWIFTPKGRIATKRDQFGADLIAINRQLVLFVQVKFGSPDRPKTVAAFRQYPFPDDDLVRIWLVVWKLRDRVPQVLDLTEQVKGERV